MYNKIFDFSDLESLEIDCKVAGFQPRFDNFLAIRAYNDKQSLVLTIDGQLLLLEDSLANCLRQFCTHNDIRKFELAVYYQLLNFQTRGLVSGRYQLVPTQGVSNSEVVYYNAHFLDSKCHLKANQRVLLTFDNRRGALYQLSVDASYHKLCHILEMAEQVGIYQLKNLEAEMHRLGFSEGTVKWSEADQIFQSRQNSRNFNLVFETKKIMQVLTTAFKYLYGQKPSDEFVNVVNGLIDNRLHKK